MVAGKPTSSFPRPKGVYFPNEERTVFLHVAGEESQDTCGSWSNDNQVAACTTICHRLVRLNEWPKYKDLKVKRIAVVSPYKAQCKKITARIKCLGLECITIDSLQGDERDYSLISTVRSNKEGAVGFLSDHRRLNVMLTRARYGTILVGDAEDQERQRKSNEKKKGTRMA